MRIVRITSVVALVSVILIAQTQGQTIVVTGKLVRAMAIGAESTGWSLELEPATTIQGKQVHSIQVSSRNPSTLEKFADQQVRVKGKIAHRHGVETGEQPVLEISSIKNLKGAAAPLHAEAASFSLANSEWLLEDLNGTGVLDNVQATLTFPESGKVAGNGSCNRFFGPAEVTGGAIKLGPLATTRMACSEGVMNQETKYVQALQDAERFEWKDPYLLIYSKGMEKPLRFTRMKAAPGTP